jgi:flavin reductase (DIM6/NTAB) family NADH-FMN oxidoreductase RutF
MIIDPSHQSSDKNYHLLTNLIVPRPIAWVSTVNLEGLTNLAPFSFFNAVGANPPYVMISLGPKADGKLKDTARNINVGRDFVVNLVTEALLNAMNISAADFPADQSEINAAELHAVPSLFIKSPRVKEAHASLECKLDSVMALGENTLFIGEVVMFHVDDQCIDQNFKIKDLAPIGRLGSPSLYCRTEDRFELARTSYSEWLSSER